MDFQIARSSLRQSETVARCIAEIGPAHLDPHRYPWTQLLSQQASGFLGGETALLAEGGAAVPANGGATFGAVPPACVAGALGSAGVVKDQLDGLCRGLGAQIHFQAGGRGLAGEVDDSQVPASGAQRDRVDVTDDEQFFPALAHRLEVRLIEHLAYVDSTQTVEAHIERCRFPEQQVEILPGIRGAEVDSHAPSARWHIDDPRRALPARRDLD